jgi:signal transduction histidine kinase
MNMKEVEELDKELHILILEDRTDDVELMEHILRKDGIRFMIEVVDSREEYDAALTTFSPDVILSDHALPQFNSLEALTMARNKGFQVPFILVTGTVSEEFAVSCLKQGADDYILKSNLARLPSAIRNALRKKMVEMKREKAEVALRTQNEELVKVNQELDSFVYSVSHNIRAPLMSVLGLITLARNEANDEGKDDFMKYFAMMESSIKKLDTTVKEILDYSKNARNEINYQPVDTESLLDECIESLKYLKGFDKIELRKKVKSENDFLSDHNRIKVIMSNLLSNAIKYSDPSKSDSYIEIEIQVREDETFMRISDNGIGISSELLPKIFNMFYRATEKSEGAGLGLYIVKETVTKLHGKIEVESAVYKGTTFTLTLPNGLTN